MVLKNTVVAPWHSPAERANDPSIGPSVGRQAGLGWVCRGDPNLVAGHAAQHPLAKQSGKGLLGGMFARRAPGTLLLDYVPPEEPPSTPLGNALRIR